MTYFTIDMKNNLPLTTTSTAELRTSLSGLRTLSLMLRDRYNFSLIDIAAVDTMRTGKDRFSVKYILLSTNYNTRLIVGISTGATCSIPSLCSVFPSAGWLEREVWDLFGLHFHEHGSLRRILTDYGFTSHPLRKDFPLTGFYEVVYNDTEGRVVSELVELAQEMRYPDY